MSKLIASLFGEDEVNGNLTPCVVAAREWRVNSLADLKHNPGTPYLLELGRPAIAMMEFVQKEIFSTD